MFAKRPFAGPQQVSATSAGTRTGWPSPIVACLAIAEGKVAFRWKDYRRDATQKTMTLDGGEFIRRFLFASCPRASSASATTASLATVIERRNWRIVEQLLDMPAPEPPTFGSR